MYRLLLLLILAFTLQTGACATRSFKAIPVSLNDNVDVGDHYSGIRLLGALQLPDMDLDGQRLCGLSGLAWDENAGLLYAISDKGILFHFRPQFDANHRLMDLQHVAAYPLRDKSGQPLRPPYTDAEGLVLLPGKQQKDTQLLVSFEIRPRLVRYSSAGRWRGNYPLPKRLYNRRSYRNSNKALESVTVDSRWGVLVGSEAPLRKQPNDQIQLFTSKGRFWRYPLGGAPGSSLVAMESLSAGMLLTLERAYTAPLRPLIISLRQTELPMPNAKKVLKVKDIAIFDSSKGWLMDNFEGLAHHRSQRFFMVSDNNCSVWQTTLLLYFELNNDRPQSAISR
ncbi:MAG: hypothetical protein CSA09_04095 [Candidatus Contendobacter odensis]|uniref:Phytase-like domain-containing protein n=1 Tax=Candidatus Contendibacter odensensis TaxID=1400860 RepID=A0A2G6PEJ6_9GAMM|nr:MAG: hypothetical protein CSA09_04095 [Candidatus Contendobacter odensis]